MAISVNYSLTTLPLSLKKGNFYLGVGDVGKGPTSGTSYYHGITPASGGYTLYVGQSGSNQPKIYTASTDSQLINLTNTLFSQSFTTIAQCAQYFIGRTDTMLLNNEPGAIVTDSLSLCLMPHNTSSYNQSTNGVWYDLINGLQFQYYGTQTPLTTLNGAKGFQFNGSGYWQCGTNYSLVDLGGDCTVIMWVYGTQGGVRKTIFQKNGTTNQSYEQELAVTWEVGNSFSYYSRLTPAYDSASMPSTTSSTSWSMNALKMSTGKTSSPRTGFYSQNGAPWTSNYASRSNVAVIPSADIVIGNGYAGICDNGGIGTVLCYNKMLSDSEILQIYNATKTYYGL